MALGEDPRDAGAGDGKARRFEPGALGALGALIAAPLFGAALGYLVLTSWVLRHVEIGYVQRIVEAARYLDAESRSDRWAAFLGHSVMRDGIDGGLVDEAAPFELRSANLAMGGFDLSEHRVVLPKLLALKPRLVVVGLSPTTGCYRREIPSDKAYGYALAGFVGDWPPERTAADFFGLPKASYEALRSTPFEQRLHFRTVLVSAFDRHLRATLRSNLRTDYVSDFVRPYQYLGTVGPNILEDHLDDTRSSIEQCGRIDRRAGLDAFFRVLGDIRESGATPVVLAYPIHPRLRAAAAPFTATMPPQVEAALARDGGVWIDASTTLDAEHFADAVHPNESGRGILSRAVGSQLPAD